MNCGTLRKLAKEHVELDIKRQSLLIEGVRYTVGNLELLKDKSGEGTSSSDYPLYDFLTRWFDDSPFMTVQTSGSTGVPKSLTVRKQQMMQSARLTCEYLDLKEGDTVLLCMNLRYIGAMMVVVRALVAGLNLIVRPASGHPLSDVNVPLRFTAMVPLQVYNTLQVPEERERMKQVEVLIIGGGAVDEALLAEIRQLPGAVYSTYGMTETLSHIALRRLNGVSASEHYDPFSSVTLSLSSEGTLVIEAPLVCDEVLQTNDMARIFPDGSFMILGRKDNVINSGGIKIQTEELEDKLRALISLPFAITFVADERLGQAVVLLIDSRMRGNVVNLRSKIETCFSTYYRPQYVFLTEEIPHTGNGKIDRKGCHVLAEKLLLHRKKAAENKR